LIDQLSRVVVETATTCLAWALMPNHFHLLLGRALAYCRCHEKGSHGLRRDLQSRTQTTRAPVSEPLQIDPVSGGALSAGAGPLMNVFFCADQAIFFLRLIAQSISADVKTASTRKPKGDNAGTGT